MSRLKSPLPVRKRTYRFALTPLADAMFQLLIFFMLSSSLTPYSLISLQSAPDAALSASAASSGPIRYDETAALAAEPTAAQGPIWRLYDGRVTTGGQEFPLDQLSQLAAAFAEQAQPETLTLLLASDARIQDVASAMAALETANLIGVRIAREARE